MASFKGAAYDLWLERNLLPPGGCCTLVQAGSWQVKFDFSCTGPIGYTLLGVPSWVRFCQQEFGVFPRMVGRYCSYLLPK